MKRTKRKIFLFVLVALSIITIGILGVNLLQKSSNAYALTVETNESVEANDGFVVLSNENNVSATYEYVALNDTECAVRMTNKATATKAVIPSFVEMDGKTYSVTEVVSNGFTSATQLERVSLPYTIKKLGNFAFANCKKLERVNLANVQQIGNNAFYRCPELKELILPKSVNIVGSNILSGNNTQVKLRGEAIGADWHTGWNSNNQNQTVEFNCKTVQPLELEPVYETAVRSTDNDIIGYALAGGQPRTDEFYITKENSDETTDIDASNNIFIPKEYNGKEIVGIANNAFEDNSFNQLVVEYSDNSLKVGTNAFAGTIGSSITFNRSIEFCDSENPKKKSNNIFTFSSIESVVLPQDITEFADQMFSNCSKLKNIYFTKPKDSLTRNELLNIVSKEALEAEEGVIYLPANSELSYIGEGAFLGDLAISKLHINDSVKYIGQFALADWDNNAQKVFIHNTKKIRDWHEKWNSTFTNIEYDKIFHTITFNADGGTVSELYKDVEVNTAIGDMPLPVKSGFVFMGWYFNDVKYNSSTIYSVNYDVELIAHWGYTVTFNKCGGTGGSDYVYAELNKLMPEAVKPERFGYDFKGYYTSPEGQGIRYYDEYMSGCRTWDKEQSITLYALWQQMKIAVEFDKEGGENGSNFVIATFDDNMPEAIAPEKTGYKFYGYYTEPNGNGDMYYNAEMQSMQICDKTERLILYAYWKQLFTITFDKSGGEGGTDTIQVVYGEDMPNAIAPTKDYNDFIGYYFEEDENPYYNSDMSSNRKMDKQQDITLIAKYTPIVYTITYNLNDSSDFPATNNPDNIHTFTYYSNVTFYEPSRPGYGFGGWYINGEKKDTISNIGTNIIVTASWVGEISVPVSNSENGYNTPYVILQFNKIIVGAKYNINIGPSVKELYIYTNFRKPADITMSIVVMDKIIGIGGINIARLSDLKLTISNINIKAVSGSHAVLMDSEKSLHLYSYNSSITGSDTLSPKNLSLATQQGSSAIYCKHLVLNTSVTLTGGSNASMSSTPFVGGVAVSLVAGGDITLKSNNIKIIGGSNYGLMGVAGYAVYANNKNYTIYNLNDYSNIIINKGNGSQPTTAPYIGY